MFKRLMLASLVAAAIAATSFTAVAAGVSYKLDPRHTNVLATWSHFGYSHPSANFGEASGTLVYDADAPGKSSVEVSLPLSGLNTFVPKLDEHLRTSDFFNAEKFPAATFKSTKVESVGAGKLKVTGDLTIKDITKPVVLDVTLNKIDAGGGKIGFDATATVVRSDFGMTMLVPAVSDEINLRITTEASVPKPAPATP